MRKQTSLIFILFLLAGACEKPYENKDIGAPIYSADNVKNIMEGKWVMSMATHVDEKSLTKESIEITDFYFPSASSQVPNITFKTADYTYTSDTNGVVIYYFGTGGTWSFDDNAYPTKIFLNTGTGIITLPIGSNLQAANGGYLEYTETASCGTDPAMTLKLKLVKQ